MSKEIEKKYLMNGKKEGNYLKVKLPNNKLLKLNLKEGEEIKQGYLSLNKTSEIIGLFHKNGEKVSKSFRPAELRLRKKGDKYFCTMKGSGSLKRDEYEINIDNRTYEKFWPETEGRRVEKIRMEVPYQNHRMEVDLYTDRKLILGEVEVSSLYAAKRLRPAGKDVTSDSNYKNKNLAK